MQKKLDSYHRKLKELDNGNSKKGILGDVVGSVKGGLSGLQHVSNHYSEKEMH